MSYKFELKLGALSLAIVLAVLGISFILPISYSGAFSKAALFPGYLLWESTNVVCPPTGSRCFLGSERAIAHHGWAFICYVIGWYALIRIVTSTAPALTKSSKRTRKQRAPFS